jgi:hypothetical protein
MCVRPEPGVMASDRCSHGKASSLRSISTSVIPAPSNQVQRETCGVSNRSACLNVASASSKRPIAHGQDRCEPERPPRSCRSGDIGSIDDRSGARGFGRRRNAGWFRENLGLEQVTVPGNEPDDLALVSPSAVLSSRMHLKRLSSLTWRFG